MQDVLHQLTTLLQQEASFVASDGKLLKSNVVIANSSTIA